MTQGARAPNNGYFRLTGLVDQPSDVRWNVGVDRSRFRKRDIRPWADLDNVALSLSEQSDP